MKTQTVPQNSATAHDSTGNSESGHPRGVKRAFKAESDGTGIKSIHIVDCNGIFGTECTPCTCVEHKARSHAERTSAGGIPKYLYVQISGTIEQISAHTTDAATTAKPPPTDTAHSFNRRSLGGGGSPESDKFGRIAR